MQLFRADWIYHQGTFVADGALLVDDAGRIAAAGPAADVLAHPGAAGAKLHALGRRALAPGTVSAHSHCFQILLRGSGDHPVGFRDWVKRHLYPLVERLDAESLEAAALLCFAQMARAGVTSVGEFHYIHNDPDYTPRSEELARLVIGAARRVGLRIAFVRTIYDVQEVIGQGRFAEEVGQAIAHTRRLHQAYQGDPFVSVLPAPHSLHGATQEAVRAAADLARELGTRWHIHMAEQRGDVAYAEHLHGATPLKVLEGWGVLDERAVLVHGIWLSEEERQLLADRKAGLVSNPITNMALGDGIAPLADLLRRGVPVALGTDMNASPNVFLEMRAAELLQRVQQLKMGVLAGAEAGQPDPARLFAMGTAHGAAALGLETGVLEPGRHADFLAVDLDDPSLLPASQLGGKALVSALISGMVPETAVVDSWVGGRPVVQGGRLAGIDSAELAERIRGARAVATV